MDLSLVSQKMTNYSTLVEDLENNIIKTYSLTPRETICIKFLSMGKTFKEIARVMHVSPRTVETHLSNVKRKLNLKTKGEIVDFFWNSTHETIHAQ